jgi:hypothetical protein
LWACYFLAGIIQQQQVVAVGGGCGGDEDSLERHFDLSQFFLIFFFSLEYSRETPGVA